LTLELGDEDCYSNFSKTISSVSPRAIAIPLLLSRDLDVSCYCSGKGGLGYLMDANAISKHLGIRLPLTIVWSSKDVYQGIAQNQALRSINMEITEAQTRLEELHSRNNEYKIKISNLVTKRKELAKANSSLHDILKDLFQLKEEQRKIRREIKIIAKASQVLNLSPCILDYAINFGMVDTEMQWSRSLLTNGNLGNPVYFTRDSSSSSQKARIHVPTNKDRL
jgi:cell division protein FtsB